MNKIKTIGIASILAICAVPAFAALPSTDWVNEQLDGKVDVNQGTGDAILITDSDGNVTTSDAGSYSELGARVHTALTYAVSKNQSGQSGKFMVTNQFGAVTTGNATVTLPTPPSECTTGNGYCLLAYSANGYAWEIVQRDETNPNDAGPTAGAIANVTIAPSGFADNSRPAPSPYSL